MKILIAICFPIQGSGSGTLVTAQADAYCKAGHEVHILLGQCREDFPRIECVKYHIVPFTADTHPTKIEGQLPFNFLVFSTHPDTKNSFWSVSENELCSYLNAFKNKLAEVVRTVDPDIIHAQHNWLLSEQCTHFNKPVVTTVHGTDLQAYLRSKYELNLIYQKIDYLDGNIEHTTEIAHLLEKKRIYEMYISMTEESAKKVNCLIAVSRQQEELCRQLFPFAANKIRTIENGYDPDIFFQDNFSYSHESICEKRNEVLSLLTDEYSKCNISKEALIKTDKLIAFVGKYADYKGVDALINAIPLIVSGMKKRNRTVHFLFLGSGDLETSLRELVQVRGLEKYVTFCGFQSQEIVNKTHSISDISVVPSRLEPFGLAALEGLASGHPVVATNVGGLSEILNPSGNTEISGDIIKTPLGFLTTPIPERLNLTERQDIKNRNIQISEYMYSNDAAYKEQVKKNFSEVSENIAESYLNAYEKSVSNLANAVLHVLSEPEIFDSNYIAAYTKEHFSISKISQVLLSLFETVLSNKGYKNEKQ